LKTTALQHSPIHEVQAIEPTSMHATQNSKNQVVSAFGAKNVSEVAFAVHSVMSS